MTRKMIIALAALAFMAWGCNNDDNETVFEGTPVTQTVDDEIQPGTDARPNWESPNYDLYEQFMTVDILLQDKLVPYVSEQDLVCATIKDEVRGVASAVQTDEGQWLFDLTVGSNEGNAMIKLSYYCDKLHRIFTIDWTPFDANTVPTGTGGIYKPIFVK
jgi:hypothetical protein